MIPNSSKIAWKLFWLNVCSELKCLSLGVYLHSVAAGVDKLVHCQQTRVPVTNPRYLKFYFFFFLKLNTDVIVINMFTDS